MKFIICALLLVEFECDQHYLLCVLVHVLLHVLVMPLHDLAVEGHPALHCQASDSCELWMLEAGCFLPKIAQPELVVLVRVDLQPEFQDVHQCCERIQYWLTRQHEISKNPQQPQAQQQTEMG